MRIQYDVIVAMEPWFLRFRAYNVSAEYDLVVFIMALVNSQSQKSHRRRQQTQHVAQYDRFDEMTSSQEDNSYTEEFWSDGEVNEEDIGWSLR